MPCLLPAGEELENENRADDQEKGEGFLIPAKGYDERRLTVVLDLDETLVANHSQYQCVASNAVVQRPHLHTFLATLSSSCEIILWTASTEEVAAHVLEAVDPFGTYFSHVITRSPKWFKGVPYTKDLRLLGRELSQTIIIENSLSCVLSNPRNAILVPDYFGYPTQTPDLSLLVVLEILEEIADYEGHRSLADFLHRSPNLKKRYIEEAGEAVFEVPAQCKPLHFVY
eukprot:TRINITY_DN981_c4_g1_i1.p1 TRINITY_DN981_c4_g1~~TRINITY_DN981_c4_g1_i1.p1  ORF type:complete len:228 (+),score=23.39 TRINITY_DN981_c4_g1_i1:62-745(+)